MPINFYGDYLREILAGVGTTRFLAGSRSRDSLDSALEEITEFKRLNEVPNES